MAYLQGLYFAHLISSKTFPDFILFFSGLLRLKSKIRVKRCVRPCVTAATVWLR